MKKLITSILTIVMVMSSISVFAKDYSNYKQKFWDVPKTHWAFEAVSELVDKNVINGYEDGSFKPDRTVNRGEWAKMMVTAANLDISDNTTVHCSDLVNHWSNRYVNAAINYLPSYNDGTYRPDMMITRDVVTASMVRLKGYNIEDVDYSILSQFRDVETIGNYMKAYVAVAVEKGLISGFEDNTFRGQDTLTRAEAATILNRAFQLGDNNIQMDVNNQSSGNNSDIGYDGFKPEPTKKPDKEDNKTNVEDKNNTQNEDKDENNKTNKDEEKDSVKDEIKENKKGYKIETLSKVNINELTHDYNRDSYHDLSDNHLKTFGNDNLYYYDIDNEEIVKMNIKTKEKESHVFKDMCIDYEDDKFYFEDLSYLTYNNTINDAVFVVSLSNREITENNSIWLSLVMRFDRSGDYILNLYESQGVPVVIGLDNQYINEDFNVADDNKTQITLNNTTNTRSKVAYNKGSYKYYGTELGLIKYDYNSYESIIDFSGSNYGINGQVKCKGFAFTNDYVYYTTDTHKGFIKTNYKGDTISIIDFSDIEVTDRYEISNYNIDAEFFVSDNEDIVFYDYGNRCFRMISKNN